jgi:predicted alpha/beta superfamily hydrolase
VPTPLGDTEVVDLWSEDLGGFRRIFVGRCGDQPSLALYLTDGNGLFGLAVDTVRLMQIPAMLPSTLVVGIGYPDVATVADTVSIRPRDLTPTASPRFDGSGGAEAFLRFIRTELRPSMQRRFPSCAESLYFGHSLGGLFGAYMLLADPASFDGFIVSSPSLWWDDRTLFDMEQARAMDHDDLAARVHFGIGGLETDEGRRQEGANLPAGHFAKPGRTHLDMVDDLIRFTDALRGRGYPSLELSVTVYPDEFHATVAASVLTHGLRELCWRTPPPC